MKFLKIFVILCLTFFAYQADAKTVKFMVASDVHYTTPETVNPSSLKAVSPKIVDGFIERANEEKPDFVMFSGDMIDKSKPQILKSFLTKISAIKRPYYLTVGNHDSFKFSGMNREDFGKIISANSRYQKEYKTNYYFCPSSEVVVIVLDNTSTGMPGTHGYFSADTLNWFDKTLEKFKNKKVIVVQHVPFIEPVENESHTLLNAKDYEQIIKRHKNIAAVISGHYHTYGVKTDENGIKHISAPALFDAPYNYLFIKVHYNKLPLGQIRNFDIDVEKRIAI